MTIPSINHLAAAALALLGCIGTASTSAQAASDIFKQFTVTSNPHAPWSYLGGPSAASETLLSTPFKSSCFNQIKHTKCWWNNQSPANSRSIIKNLTKSPIHFLTIIFPTDHLSLDPENGAITVEWAAPSAGTYQIAGDFTGTDTGEASHPVQITDGGASALFSSTISSYGQSTPFNVSVQLAKGQAVDFSVLVGGTPSNLSTGLAGTITKTGN